MARVVATRRYAMQRLIVTSILLLFCALGWSQSIPSLERKVTIAFQNEPIDAALSKLSKAANFTFSYNPSILDLSQTFSESFTDKSVREVMNVLLGPAIVSKVKGNYVILNRAPDQVKKASNDPPSITISGYVFNSASGEKMQEVSVYDKTTLTAAVTDQYGYFKLKIDKPGSQTVLSFNKLHFFDTLINIPHQPTAHFLNVSLTADMPTPVAQVEEEVAIDSIVVAEPDIVEVLPPRKRTLRERWINMLNIRDTLYRDFQVSFVPFIGTNHELSGNIINKYSFNILGGYSRGTTELEIGGLFNIDREDVGRVQIAGLANAVGGDVRGAQAAGLANMVKGNVSAWQFAGLYNLNGGTLDGPQFAGLFNLNLKEMDGPQFAGLFNINVRDARGAQFAGLFNVQPGNYRGGQGAGLFNVTTGSVTGTQIASLFNFARNVHGSQVGLLNISDSIRGVPVGLFSFSRRGYHKLEISADEIFLTNIAFRTGVRQFYNILTAGVKPENTIGKENVWSFGYGVGTAPRISDRLFLNFDLTSHHVNKGSFTNSISLLNRLYMGVDFQISRGFSVTAGATLNGYLTDSDFSENPEVFTHYTPSLIADHTYAGGNNLKMWWGAKVGLRFF